MRLTPILGCTILAILLPVLFYIWKPKLARYSLPCAAVLDVLLYWQEFCYYESRGFLLLLMVGQLIGMTVVLSILKDITGNHN